MTQQERNKQIAFMLCTYDKDTLRFIFEKELWSFITLRCGKRHHEEQLCFHSDWNWLMEAVEFIENKGYRVAIQDTCCQVVDNDAFYNEEVEASTKKEAVFIAVSDFAKLYNEKKL